MRTSESQRIPFTPGRRLDGEVVIVTGASGSLGRAICVAAAREGARVVAVGRDAARLAETLDAIRRECGSSAAEPVVFQLDVCSEDDIENMRDSVRDRFGRIDVLIVAHGIGGSSAGNRALPHPFARLPLEDWSAVIDTNLKGVFLINRAVLPVMVAQGRGHIINVSSARGGLRGQAFGAAYCASKFGVRGLSEALAEEVQRLGIRVEVILPEAVESTLIANTGLGSGRRKSLQPERVSALALHMLTRPDDVVLSQPLIEAFSRR